MTNITKQFISSILLWFLLAFICFFSILLIFIFFLIIITVNGNEEFLKWVFIEEVNIICIQINLILYSDFFTRMVRLDGCTKQLPDFVELHLTIKVLLIWIGILYVVYESIRINPVVEGRVSKHCNHPCQYNILDSVLNLPVILFWDVTISFDSCVTFHLQLSEMKHGIITNRNLVIFKFLEAKRGSQVTYEYASKQHRCCCFPNKKHLIFYFSINILD